MKIIQTDYKQQISSIFKMPEAIIFLLLINKKKGLSKKSNQIKYQERKIPYLWLVKSTSMSPTIHLISK